MCRVLGTVFCREFPMDTLRDLRDVARTGLIPGEPTPGHRDGWGIVSFRNGSPLYIGRSSRPIFSDESYDSAMQDVLRLQAPNILIAHARALSVGVATIANTHPFVMDGIVLCHNGTISDIRFKPRHRTKGESDSELLLARLADRVEDSRDLERSIEGLILEDVRSHEHSAAIMLISDGKKLYAYRDFSAGRSAEYYDLKMAQCGDYVAFFQETRRKIVGDMSQIDNRELVSVDLNMSVRRKNLS